MPYKLHRIAANSYDWQRPSPGRLGADNVGGYVKTHGFGHEDWNFNTQLAEDDHVWAYTRAELRKDLQYTPITLILATWDPANLWQAVGYYLNAEYVDGPSVSFAQGHLQQRAEDILRLADTNDLGGGYAGGDLDHVLATLRREMITYKWWKVPVESVFLFRQPIALPRILAGRGRQRMTTSFNFPEGAFEDLLACIADRPPVGGQSVDAEFPEGAIVEAIHRRRERDPRLVNAAKQAFREKHGKLFCQVCNFDFNTTYGEDYIEAHHKIPLSDFPTSMTVTIDDLVMVCANCHRMFHRVRPWMSSVEELQNLIRERGRL
jgi:5-methylcytosine-specific restriction protein A